MTSIDELDRVIMCRMLFAALTVNVIHTNAANVNLTVSMGCDMSS